MARALTFDRIEKALRASHGVITTACATLGCSRTAMYHWLEKHPELKQIREEAEEELCDLAENVVEEYIKAKDAKMVRWYLERRRKDKYSTRVENTGPDGSAMETITEIKTTFVDDGQDT